MRPPTKPRQDAGPLSHNTMTAPPQQPQALSIAVPRWLLHGTKHPRTTCPTVVCGRSRASASTTTLGVRPGLVPSLRHRTARYSGAHKTECWHALLVCVLTCTTWPHAQSRCGYCEMPPPPRCGTPESLALPSCTGPLQGGGSNTTQYTHGSMHSPCTTSQQFRIKPREEHASDRGHTHA